MNVWEVIQFKFIPFQLYVCTDGAARDSSSLFLVVGQFDVSLFVFSCVSEDRV